ncbi:MAG: GtrA family protein [Verrucomicrobiales bacterium]
MNLPREISLAWSHLRDHGLKASLLGRGPETPFLIQFGKYGLCGVLSVVIFALVVTLGQLILPEKFALSLASAERSRNIALLHFLAFLPSNFTAYYLNRLLVFTPGRHRPLKEISLFTLISFISFSLGELLPLWLVSQFNVPNLVAHGSFIVSSALINFIARKFLVFEH